MFETARVFVFETILWFARRRLATMPTLDVWKAQSDNDRTPAGQQYGLYNDLFSEFVVVVVVLILCSVGCYIATIFVESVAVRHASGRAFIVIATAIGAVRRGSERRQCRRQSATAAALLIATVRLLHNNTSVSFNDFVCCNVDRRKP